MKYRIKDKQARNLKILAYRENGYTMRAIAGIFHISTAMVCRIIHRAKREL